MSALFSTMRLTLIVPKTSGSNSTCASKRLICAICGREPHGALANVTSFDRDGRRQAEREFQIAVDREVASGRLLDLFGDGAAVLVEIHASKRSRRQRPPTDHEPPQRQSQRFSGACGTPVVRVHDLRRSSLKRSMIASAPAARELLGRVIAPCHADAAHAGAARHQHVEAGVADHDDIVWRPRRFRRSRAAASPDAAYPAPCRWSAGSRSAFPDHDVPAPPEGRACAFPVGYAKQETRALDLIERRERAFEQRLVMVRLLPQRRRKPPCTPRLSARNGCPPRDPATAEPCIRAAAVR